MDITAKFILHRMVLKSLDGLQWSLFRRNEGDCDSDAPRKMMISADIFLGWLVASCWAGGAACQNSHPL